MTLSDKMKFYEKLNSTKLMPGLPAFARLDGKNFSKFTKSLEKPYDTRLSILMIKLTEFLVKKTNAKIGYTQSDEITLMWYNEKNPQGIFYEGKVQKMIGELTALASVFFNKELVNFLPEKIKEENFPRFDARVWNVPNLQEAINVFIWRERDATRNSITMAAHSVYSHNDLLNKNSSDKQDMLMKKGINWNNYPSFFKRGTYVKKVKKSIKFSKDEIERLPLKHSARNNPDLEILRSVIEIMKIDPIESIDDKLEILFDL